MIYGLKRVKQLMGWSADKKFPPVIMVVGVFLFIFSMTYLRSYRIPEHFVDVSGTLDRAYRVSIGLLPYRDFYCPVTPGHYYLQAGLWKIFGYSIEVIKISRSIFNAILGVLLLFFLYSVGLTGVTALIISMVFLFFSTYYICSFSMYDTGVFVSSYLFILCLFHCFSKPRTFWVFLTGLFCGVTFLFKQNGGAACLGAFLVSWGVQFDKNDRWKTLGLFLLGTLLAIVPFFTYYVLNHAVSDLIEWLVIRAYLYKTVEVSGHLRFLLAPLTVTVSMYRFVYVIFTLFIMAWILPKYQQTRFVDIKTEEVSQWRFFNFSAGLITYALMLTSSEYKLHIGLLWVPIATLFKFARSPRLKIGVFIVSGLLILQSLRITLLFSYFIDPDTPSLLTQKPFQTAELKGFYDEEPRVRKVDKLFIFLKENVKDENIFVFPDEYLFAYYILKKIPPTPLTVCTHQFDVLETDQQEILESLIKNNVRWVILSPLIDPSQNRLRKIIEYIAEHFEVRYKIEDILILYGPNDLYRASKSSQEKVLQFYSRFQT